MVARKFDFKWLLLWYTSLYIIVICGCENMLSKQKLQTRNTIQTKFCSAKFSHIGNHSACLPQSPFLTRQGISPSEREVILREHNKYRAMVQPPASDMLKLTWDDEIAMIAQAWADNCHIGHDLGEHRNIPGRLSLGQNFGSDFLDWPSCIKAWFDENKKFVYNGTTSLKDVGHYTQLVWADTVKLGCGYAECSTPTGSHGFQVCNYGPQGNLGGHRTPYKQGEPCSECPHNCVERLCDCQDKVCYNGGMINRRNCQCVCNQPFLVGDTCALNCSLATELEVRRSSCGSKPFDKKGCTVFGNEPDACPVLCGVCPYGDMNYTDPDFLSSSTAKPSRHCKDKFRIIRDHSACLPPSTHLGHAGVQRTEKRLILDIHNNLRKTVTPSATNMMKLVWDEEAAMVAQIWAESCQFKHDQPTHRAIPGKLSLGQNIAVGANNWTAAILSWHNERNNFIFDGNNSLENTAQYFQLVWHETTRLGCGYAQCKGDNFFVCNYGPSSKRRLGTDVPYEQGKSCSDCPYTCTAGLCDCGVKFCENEGKLNPDTCSCCCKTDFYKQDKCSLDCDAVKEEEGLCGGHDAVENCYNYVITSIYCPRLCRVCPYAGTNYTDVGVTSLPVTGTSTQHPHTVSRSTHAQIVLVLMIYCGISAMTSTSR